MAAGNRCSSRSQESGTSWSIVWIVEGPSRFRTLHHPPKDLTHFGIG